MLPHVVRFSNICRRAFDKHTISDPYSTVPTLKMPVLVCSNVPRLHPRAPFYIKTSLTETLFFCCLFNLQVYDFSDEVQYRGWFLLFCLFWTLNFITAMGQVKSRRVGQTPAGAPAP